jgi:hypothetical protein
VTATGETITEGARNESPLWAASLRPEPEWVPVFGELVPDAIALGLETVYEAYLVHYGRGRLFAPDDPDEAVLLGDYLYAHGLVRIADAGGVAAVAVMAELIATCAALRAAGEQGDGDAWIEAVRGLGGAPDAAQISAAMSRHSARVAS